MTGNVPPEPMSGDSRSPPEPAIGFALVFEGSLGLLALGLAWLTGIPLGPWGGDARQVSGDFAPWLSAVAWGVAGTVPLLGLLLFVEWLPLRFLRELGTLVQQKLGPLLQSASWWQLGLLSLLAGVGEELLFRGWLQFGVGQWLFGSPSSIGGLLLGALLFGVCHAVTRTYAVVAGLVGLYLGLLQIVSGHLLAPMIAHAGYDFIALLYLLKWHPGVERGNAAASP
jgi:uncharacterized protein